ncbi:peptidase M24, structural domain-containing protein [Filobasidium floriforme]|uniref:peptidase M24, structural domain-containing protein n=1 Tax=Filobasidium floriforme TaxID=5210 RepID=UPI001E8D48A3|nr:peptidase M24, structural domain-containing protein [Filobasidium floriforme]KAH8090450.1 peptidase M24, structural domain-containing protein [Filobasidium floriforme]
MKASTSLLRPLRDTAYGKYDVLRPLRSRAGRKPASFTRPLPVPLSIIRPSYVPVNFWSRNSDDEKLVIDDEFEDLEGWKGDSGIGESSLGIGMIPLGGVEERTIRHVARIASEVLRDVETLIQPGAKTTDLDRTIHGMILARDAYPSPLGYQGFPKSVTTSVNNVICHGIPDERSLEESDLVNVDVTIYSALPEEEDDDDTIPVWMHGDTSRTFALPAIDTLGKELIECTREALEVGIRKCGPGLPFSEIGTAIEAFATKHGFSVNRQFTGHGIGERFHTAPWIVHHKNDLPGLMQPGHCFTIEPCLVQGDQSRGYGWIDGWTYATESNARSAQFEHQLLVTENGVDVLTRI